MTTIWDIIPQIPHRLATIDGHRAIWLEGRERFAQDVVGESHYIAHLLTITGGRSFTKASPLSTGAWLTHETDNPHDEYAVSVWIHGGKVGYLPREVAGLWWQILRALHGLHGCFCACPAIILGGGLIGGSGVLYGVTLYLPICLDAE